MLGLVWNPALDGGEALPAMSDLHFDLFWFFVGVACIAIITWPWVFQ